MKLKIKNLLNYLLVFSLSLALSYGYGQQFSLVEVIQTTFSQADEEKVSHSNLIYNEVEEDAPSEGSQKNQPLSKILSSDSGVSHSFVSNLWLSAVVTTQSFYAPSSGCDLYIRFRNLRL